MSDSTSETTVSTNGTSTTPGERASVAQQAGNGSAAPVRWRPWRNRLAISLLVIAIIGVQPALAQSNVVCNAEKLPDMIEGFFRITTTIGIVGLAVVWQADSLIDMFMLNPEQKKGLKRHKRAALKSAVILLVLGPVYSVAGSVMGLPLAQCVDLVPW